MVFKRTLKSEFKIRQQGVVLVTSLVLLLVMTLIGLTGMQVTSLEEKMASNMRDSNLAFQSAESALRAGEQSLNVATLPSFSNAGINGLYTAISAETILNNIDDTTEWTAGQTAVHNAGNFANIASAPQYIIQQMNVIGAGGGSLDGSVFSTGGFFRVTARGVGATTTAVKVVQSIFRRP